MHYYSFNIADFASHTSHLSDIEELAYRRLIDWQYLNEKPIPSDIKQASRLIRLNERSTDVEQVLNEFYTKTEQGFINSRCFDEIEAYRDKLVKASAAGKASAKARQDKKDNREQRIADFNGRSTDVQQTFNQPLTNNHKPLTNSKANNIVKRSSTEVAEVFECWQDTMKHPQSKLDDKRKKLIRSGLKIGYSVSDLKQAIIGCSLTPHNIGQNDRGQRYDGLNIILKSSDNIERFIENSRSPPKLALITATSQRGSGIQKMKELAGIR